MRYRISHVTSYGYEQPVSICHHVARLMPRSTPSQSVESTRVDIEPLPAIVRRRRDYFGNFALFFTVQEPHEKLVVTARSEVEVSPTPYYDPRNAPRWEDVRDRLKTNRSREMLSAYQFAFPSPYVPSHSEVSEYARASFPPGRPIVEGALDLTARIHSDFRYDPEFTTTTTPIITVMKERRGVCQDFAHLQISCLRSLGLAARYVSGYLRTIPPPGRDRLVGADASHAWVSIYCPPIGWIDLDPTNNRIPSDEHITLAWGRDYGDVSPTQGIIQGGGEHDVEVSVDVEPVTAGA